MQLGRQHLPRCTGSSTTCNVAAARLALQLHQQNCRRPRKRAFEALSAGEDNQGLSDGPSTSSTGAAQSQPAPSSTAAATGSTQPSSTAAAASSKALEQKAKQKLRGSWTLLKDGPGNAFSLGNKTAVSAQPTINSQNARPKFRSYSATLHQATSIEPDTGIANGQQAPSLSNRLWRLVTGQFIREKNAEFSATMDTTRSSPQPVDAQVAAVQFELLQSSQQQPQRQPPLPAGGVLLDVVPDTIVTQADQQQQQTPRPAETTQQAASAAAAAAAAGAGTAGAAAATAGPADLPMSSAFYPASTEMLVLGTWLVFVLQWGPALPELWQALKQGSILQSLMAVMLIFPDNQVTRALCLDLSTLQHGYGWLGLLSSGLCHSGLASTLLCCAALKNCGRWLEAGTGQLHLLTMFLLTTLFASLAHLLAGKCVLGAAGPGAIVGMYTAWTVTAAQHLQEHVPMQTIYSQGALLLVLMLALGLLQPAVGVASILGGMVGGVVATRVAGPLSLVLRWLLAVPSIAGLMLLRVGLDLFKLAWLTVVFVVTAAYQLVVDVVGTVRRL